MEILNSITGKCFYKGSGSLRDAVEGAVRKRVSLSYADLRGANLRYADLRGANLRYADLRGANLRYADLSYADLRYADLRGANLRWADLRAAKLSGADLRGANLRYVDLSYADLGGADFFAELNLLRLLRVDPLGLWTLFNISFDRNRLSARPSHHFGKLCGCDELHYRSDGALHFTWNDCRDEEMVYCIPYDDPHKGIRQHKKGECPYTEYAFNK